MSELEQKLNSVLENPEMMQKIMSLAQNLGQREPSAHSEASPKQENILGGLGDIDLSMLQRVSGIARQSGIDKNQQALLHALAPYLSRHRIAKLERAMRAAKMAGIATTFLGR